MIETPAAPAELPPLRRNRDFVLLWSGQAVSSIGTSLAAVAYPLLALVATGSPAQAGMIGFGGLVAMVFGALPAGVLADRYSIRALMIGSRLVSAIATSTVVIAVAIGHVTFAQLLLAAVVTSVCGPLFFASETVAIRHVVPPTQLSTALAQTEARGHLADLIGQPIGGYLYGIGAALPIVADTISFAASAVLVWLVRGRLPGGRPQTAPRAPMFAQIFTGLMHIWRTSFLRTTLVCSAGINIAFAGLTLAVVASRPNAGAAHLGLAFGLGSVGGLVGAWTSGRLLRRISPAHVIFGFGWMVSLALALLSQAHDVYVIGALLASINFVCAPANGVLFAAQINATPPDMQGRVISAAVAMLGATTPLGPLLAGVIIERSGQAAAFLTFAAIVAGCTLAMQCSKSVRQLPRMNARHPEPQLDAAPLIPVS